MLLSAVCSKCNAGLLHNFFSSNSVVLNRWATARKSGGPQTFAYFNNGFASRMRLRNTGTYEQPYGPAPMQWWIFKIGDLRQNSNKGPQKINVVINNCNQTTLLGRL